MTEEYIRKRLFELQDISYREFHSKLMPTVEKELVIGVRTPDLRKLAKEISNISVEKGYYYRVCGVHSVQEGSTIETTNSVTDPISFF